MKNRLLKITIILTIIVFTLICACQKTPEAKPTPVFEFQQFNPTKAPVQPTAIRDTAEVNMQITEAVTP